MCSVLSWCDILEEVPSMFKILAEISKIVNICKQWMATQEISSLVPWFQKRNFVSQVHKMLQYLTCQNHLTFLCDIRLEYLAWTSWKSCLSSLCYHSNALIRVYSFYQYIQNVCKWMNFGGETF